MVSRSALPALCVALVALLGGCGDDDSSDTPTTPVTTIPTTGPVSMTVLNNSDVPTPGVDVIFGDVNGAVLHHTQTDAAGQASFTMDIGGMVTVAVRNPQSPGSAYLQTITNVRPTDVYRSHIGAILTVAAPRLGAIQIDFAGPLPPGTVSIQIDLGCQSRYLYPAWGGSIHGYVTDVFAYCPLPADGRLDVVLTAQNGESVPIAFAISRDNALNPSSTTIAHFPDGWRTDFRTLSVGYSNVTAGMALLRSAVTPEYEGLTRGRYPRADATVFPGQSGTRVLLYPDLADALSFSVQLMTSPTGWNAPQVVYNGFFTETPVWAGVDFATDVPPFASNVVLIDVATGRPAVTWTAPADVSNVDLGSYSLNWGTGNQYRSWAVAFPPDAVPPVKIPALPEALAAWRPPAAPQEINLGGVVLQGDSRVSGYHEYLTTPTGDVSGFLAYSYMPPATAVPAAIHGRAPSFGTQPDARYPETRASGETWSRLPWLWRAERLRTQD